MSEEKWKCERAPCAAAVAGRGGAADPRIAGKFSSFIDEKIEAKILDFVKANNGN